MAESVEPGRASLRTLGVAAFLLLLLATPGAGATPRASQPASVYVSVTGSDATCARSKPSLPCATFERAYQLARCGETIEVEPGAYGFQQITHDASKRCTSYVVFRPPPGVSRSAVTLTSNGNGQPGCPGGGDWGCMALALGAGSPPQEGGPTWIELTDMTIAGDLYVVGNGLGTRGDHILLDQIDGGGGAITDATNFVLQSSSMGPCQSDTVSPHTAPCSSNFILNSFVPAAETTAVLLNDVFHDFQAGPPPGDHFECVFLLDVKTVTIEGSRFYNCENYGIHVELREAPTSVVVENNWFGPTASYDGSPRASALEFSGFADESTTNVLARRNSFIAGQGITQESGSIGADVRIEANILGFGGHCIPNAVYAGNFWRGSPCSDSTGLEHVPFGYTLDGNGQFHPAGKKAVAVTRAFDLVGRGIRLTAVARRLRTARLPAPQGGWNVRTVTRVVSDAFYQGGTLGSAGSQPALVTRTLGRRVCKLVTC